MTSEEDPTDDSKTQNSDKKCDTLFDLCVSSLRRGHANLLCIVPILTDDPGRESNHKLQSQYTGAYPLKLKRTQACSGNSPRLPPKISGRINFFLAFSWKFVGGRRKGAEYRRPSATIGNSTADCHGHELRRRRIGAASSLCPT